MKKSSGHIRHVILGKLYARLEERYAISLSEGVPPQDLISLQQIDAILAFKSDSYLDELRGALDRLEEGTFGICLGCKAKIHSELMDANPTRRMCDRCEKEFSHVVLRREEFPLPV